MGKQYHSTTCPSISIDENLAFDADPTIISRAGNYVAKMPPSISGQEGHNALFRVSCVLTQKFALGHDDAAQVIKLRFNDRCDPPWSDEEIYHKVTDAIAVSQSPKPKTMAKSFRVKTASAAAPPQPRLKPQLSDVRPLTAEDITELSQLRGIPEAGIKLQIERGLLFKTLFCGLECFGVQDRSKCLIEVRRLDGKLFPAHPNSGLGERKSHAIRGSNKKWPLGAIEAMDYSHVALVEGIPDSLYAHHLIVKEAAQNHVAAVAMLSASPEIDEAALVFLYDKTVRIYPHLDAAGLKGARRWQKQLQEAGARHVDLFDLSGLRQHDGKPVNDLCDLTGMSSEQFKSDTTLKSILP